MTQREFFEKVLRDLESLQIPYMVTGSIASMMYGEPRLTIDLDVVIELDPSRIDALSASFPAPDFYFPPAEFVHDYVRRRGQFSILHVKSGSKADMIIRKDTGFAQTEFQRKRRVPFSPTLDVASATPEDVILSKLLYYREGESEKHLRDIHGILVAWRDRLDRPYLQEWIKRLGLDPEWAKAEAYRIR